MPSTSYRFGPVAVELVQGDITQEDVDAIVDAANEALRPGGGVDGAIHRAAGPELAQAARKLAPCPTGDARIAPGFRLPARHVIFTVGPRYRGRPQDAALLAKAVQSSLRLADEHGLHSVALPAISTGIYGYPMDEAARVILAAIRELAPQLESVRLVRVVLFRPRDLEVFAQALADLAELDRQE